MGNTVLSYCHMEGMEGGNVNIYHSSMIEEDDLIRSNNQKLNKANNYHNRYSYSLQIKKSQHQQKIIKNKRMHFKHYVYYSSPTLTSNNFPFRSNKIQTIYYQLRKYSIHSSLYSIDPINHSIYNQSYLYQFNVTSLMYLGEKLSNYYHNKEHNEMKAKISLSSAVDDMRRSHPSENKIIYNNLRLMRFDYLQPQVENDFFIMDKVAYRERALSRGSYLRSSEYIFINSTIKINNNYYQYSSLPLFTPSLYNYKYFFITNKSYLYIGHINPYSVPHGSGQLYGFKKNNDFSFYNDNEKNNSNKTGNNLYLYLFIYAYFVNGSILTNDVVIINCNGSYYRGGFVGGVMHGRGKVSQCDGLVLEGNFVHGLLYGRGRVIYPDRGSYSGYFHQGLRSGKGIMTWRSHQPNTSLAIVYDGYFESDKMYGLGYLTTPNYEYWGPFVSNMKYGKGTLKFNDGSKYEGWFYNDYISGYGELHYPDGYVYKGMFPLKKEY